MEEPPTVIYDDVYELADALSPVSLYPPSLASIRRLHQEQPQSMANFKDYQQQTLLHKCIDSFPQHPQVAKVLLECCGPQVLAMEDSSALLPLEILITKKHSLGFQLDFLVLTLQLLLKGDGAEALVHENDSGQFPLHLALQPGHYARENVDLILPLVQGFPDALRHPDNRGKYPLQYALEVEKMVSFLEEARMAPAQVLQVLIDAAPTVLRDMVPNEEGQLPLHQAVKASLLSSTHRRGTTDRITADGTASGFCNTVALLADRFPRALLLQDNANRTPLQRACCYRSSSGTPFENQHLDIVYSLVRQWPEQVTQGLASVVFEDRRWNGELLPVALASESATLERVQAWVALHQKEHDNVISSFLQVPDGAHQRLPLHYAASSKSPEAFEIVQCLMLNEPKAATVADAFHRFPLHYAVLSTSPDAAEMVQLLVQEYPNAMTAADVDGLLPWHYAECAASNFGYANQGMADTLYDQTLCHDPTADVDGYQVPEEVRWDLVQVSPTGILGADS